jgi:hypothetical protein
MRFTRATLATLAAAAVISQASSAPVAQPLDGNELRDIQGAQYVAHVIDDGRLPVNCFEMATKSDQASDHPIEVLTICSLAGKVKLQTDRFASIEDFVAKHGHVFPSIYNGGGEVSLAQAGLQQHVDATSGDEVAPPFTGFRIHFKTSRQSVPRKWIQRIILAAMAVYLLVFNRAFFHGLLYGQDDPADQEDGHSEHPQTPVNKACCGFPLLWQRGGQCPLNACSSGASGLMPLPAIYGLDAS